VGYVQINGYDVPEKTDVYWNYTSGVSHSELMLTLPKELAEKIFKIEPYGITITMVDEYGDKVEIKHLSCVDIERDNYLKSAVRLVDPRYFIQFLRWVGRYNMRGIVNEYSIVETAPRAARDWWFFPDYTWLYWSVKDGIAPNWDEQIPPRGTPYTTLELADKIMTDIFASPGLLGLYGGIKASPYFAEAAPDNLEFVAQPVQSVLQHLLLYAYADICYDTDNKLKIFCINDEYGNDVGLLDIQSKRRTETDLAGLEIHDFKNQTPKEIRVFFNKEQEIIVEATTDNKRKQITLAADKLAAQSPDFSPDVRNVTAVPRNMEILGVFYKKGTYVQIDHVLQELGISEKILREKYRHPTFLIAIYAEHIGMDVNKFIKTRPLELQLLMGIKSDYRVLYQINPEWMSKIITLKAVRATIVDYVTGTRQPSLVWTNYSGAFNLRYAAEFIDDPEADWGWDRKDAPVEMTAEEIIARTDNDANREKSVETLVSDFQVSVENEKLGIIRFTSIKDLQLQIYDNFPSVIKERPTISIQQIPVFWQRCDLVPEHRVITVLTAIFAVPNDPDCLHYVDVDVDKIGKEMWKASWIKSGTYPKRYEYLSTRINARYDYTGECANTDLIQAMAEAEAKKALRFLRNRLEGTLKLGGVIVVDMFGYCKSISYHYENGGIKTKVHIPITPPPVELYSLAGRYAKRIFGELETINIEDGKK